MLGEHLCCKQNVVSSILTVSTTYREVGRVRLNASALKAEEP